MFDTSAATVLPMAAGEAIDLDGSWDTLWGAIVSAAGMERLVTLASIIGLALVVGAILAWIWQRRRGGRGRSGGLIVAIVIGAALAGPDVLLPRLLWITDALVNAFVSLLDAV